MWWSVVATASTLVLGEPEFRAPDGIARAVVPVDGAPWVISTRGEVTGFDRKGRIRATFQACTDRSPHLELTVDRSASRVGVDCGDTYRVFSLPRGELLFEVEAFTVGAAFSPDGRELALLGERITDGKSEDTSWLLRYDAAGRALKPIESRWEAVWGVTGGWVGATRDEGRIPLTVEGRIQAGPTILKWQWVAPDELVDGADWGPEQAVAVVDGGRRVCIQLDYGGACLDGRNGGARNVWSVPAGERTDANRAVPHPDGLAMGTELWFERAEGIYRWDMDGNPEKLDSADGIPVASPDGSVRFRVEAARLVPMDAFGHDTTDERWGLPISVARSEDGTVLVLVDSRGRVFLQKLSGGVTRLEGKAETVALSPDGRTVWMFEGGTARTLDVTTGSTQSVGTGAVAFSGTRVWTVEGSPPRLVERAAPETGTAVAEVLEVTGLQARGDRVLVEYAEDDAWHLVENGAHGALGSHPFMDVTDLVLTERGVIGVAEAEDGWRVGRRTVPWTTAIRFVDDGTRFVELVGDGRVVEVRDFPSGDLRATHELPARWSDVWTHGQVAMVALRDGRLVVLDL